jgi:hypothetical protein
MTHERCDACGFDGSRVDDAALIAAIRDLGPRWQALLAAAGAELRSRPQPGVWSALEYAAHSRDITALHLYGVREALTGDEPTLPAIAGDDLVDSAATGYAREDPNAVAVALAGHASLLAEVASAAGFASWSRGITIGDSRIDVRGLLEHALHDSSHHLRDVELGLSALRESPASPA